MIKGNEIFFGHGTVAVGCGYMSLDFTEIRPPQEVGESLVGKEYEKLESIEISADLDEFSTLKNQLEHIHKQKNKCIEFKGYILNFNNYNRKSIDVILKAIGRAIYLHVLSLAC